MGLACWPHTLGVRLAGAEGLRAVVIVQDSGFSFKTLLAWLKPLLQLHSTPWLCGSLRCAPVTTLSAAKT